MSKVIIAGSTWTFPIRFFSQLAKRLLIIPSLVVVIAFNLSVNGSMWSLLTNTRSNGEEVLR
jgi:hypothetical protein